MLMVALATGTSGVDSLSDLAKQGILGLVASLLILALVWVTKNWKRSMEDRLKDAAAFGKDLKEVNDAATTLIVETNRTSDALRTTCVALQGDIQESKRSVQELREKQTEFIAAAKGLGK